MSIEAMKQALEALEKLWDIIDDIDTYGDMAKSDDKLYRSLVERRQRQRFEQTGISTDGYELNGGVITSLRQAIAEAEKQQDIFKQLGNQSMLQLWQNYCDVKVERAELQEKLAEAEKQEPVAWYDSESGWTDFHSFKPARKPSSPSAKWLPLYTHPQPKREPLTDEQVEKIIKANMSLQMNLAGIRQDFEAAHGIKE
jgi:hypothetical protein